MEALEKANNIVAFTGAGMSAESGVSTFRGQEGIWSKFKPEELATMNAFLRNPTLVWEWYSHRRKIISETRPNAGHRALAKMEMLVSSLAVVTQNIDNLHIRAGSATVYELHGNIERSYCVRCGKPEMYPTLPEPGTVPRCTADVNGRPCEGLIRPDVVWFGEMLPEDQWELSVKAIHRADILFSIGTSSVVYPAASLPHLAKAAGALIVEINPEDTPLTPEADEFLRGASGVILPALCDAMALRKGIHHPQP